jgi:hypothetical protein
MFASNAKSGALRTDSQVVCYKLMLSGEMVHRTRLLQDVVFFGHHVYFGEHINKVKLLYVYMKSYKYTVVLMFIFVYP